MKFWRLSLVPSTGSLAAPAFPWSYQMEARTSLLKDEFLAEVDLDTYAQAAYDKTIAATPRLEGENSLEARRREIAYLNVVWFMATLLNRMDRTSMYSGLEARVPLPTIAFWNMCSTCPGT